MAARTPNRSSLGEGWLTYPFRHAGWGRQTREKICPRPGRGRGTAFFICVRFFASHRHDQGGMRDRGNARSRGKARSREKARGEGAGGRRGAGPGKTCRPFCRTGQELPEAPGVRPEMGRGGIPLGRMPQGRMPREGEAQEARRRAPSSRPACVSRHDVGRLRARRSPGLVVARSIGTALAREGGSQKGGAAGRRRRSPRRRRRVRSSCRFSVP